MSSFTMFAKTPIASTQVFFDSLFSGLLIKLCKEKKTAIITDANILKLYGSKLSVHLNAKTFVVATGESAKTIQSVEALAHALLEDGFGKDCVLVALGGGAVTDLVGFIASIYMRGVSFISVPTTLLAMVDASIGGKTAINTPFGKNLLGSFYHPTAIVIDTDVLKTLPLQEILHGEAEILKLGLVFDASIWEQPDFMQRIKKAVFGKISVIEKDPTETGLRRILNFGHTIGHALEKISNFQMPHGKAVALGSLAEAHLCMSLGMLAKNVFETIVSRYAMFSPNISYPYTKESLWQAMLYDKKNFQNNVHFVCIDQIGHALEFQGKYLRSVNLQELQDTLHWMKTYG